MLKLLLITGDLAAGKSAFAEILSEKFDIPCFGKDFVKEILGDVIGFANREENLKLSKASNLILGYIFEEFAQHKRDLILESNFHAQELENLHRIACANDYRVLTLVLRGDVATLHQRYLKRLENRHPVHASTTFHIFNDFEKYILESRKDKIFGQSITVQADDFSYQKDVKLLDEIKRFFNS